MLSWIFKGFVPCVCNLGFDGNLSADNLLIRVKRIFRQSDDVVRELIFCSPKISLQPNILPHFMSAYCRNGELLWNIVHWRFKVAPKDFYWARSIHRFIEVLSPTLFGVRCVGTSNGNIDLDSYGTILHSCDNLILVCTMVIWSALLNVNCEGNLFKRAVADNTMD